VPLGGGVILASRSLVVTQPDAGSFRGFDTHCTHAGCPVDRVAEGTIDCPCHSSRFSVADGSPVAGPARRPLEPRRLVVRDGGIYLA
jgi:Rieske Fe-S protein